MKKYLYSFFAGSAGFIALIVFYFVLMRLLAGSWGAAISQFSKLWYYMIPLSIGFGIQAGLYNHLRSLIKNNNGKNMVMANTTTSAIGMVACCAHHLTDAFPFLGLAAFSTLLTTFQTPILIVGIISNILGVHYLLRKIQYLDKN